MAIHISVRHIDINKANNRLAITVAVAVIVSVFCLMSAKSLLSQSSYQRRVLKEKHTAANQLKANVNAAKQLMVQYKVFQEGNPNIIGGQGGTNAGNGPSDGDNAKIVLDSLPSQYDFPALVSSVEKILAQEGITVQGIGGTDQGQPSNDSTGSPQPVDMTFSVDALTSYDGSRKLVEDFERSIRPIDVNNIQMSGTQDTLHFTINSTTYYQPAKSFTVGQKEVR